MRIAAIAALAGAAVLFGVAPAGAQKMGKKGPDKKEMGKKEFVFESQEIGGKHLDTWIAEIRSEDSSKAENAIRTVLLFGPDLAPRAVPTLVAVLKKHAPPYYPLDVSVRANACFALGVILEGAQNLSAKETADAIAMLRRMLKDTQDIIKYRAAQALMKAGPDARAAIGDLIYATRDQNNWETRQAAALALGKLVAPKIGPEPRVIIQLVKVLRNDKACQVRLGALQGLTWLELPRDRQLKQEVEKAIEYAADKDADKTVQVAAQVALMVLHKKAEPARVTVLGKFLSSPDTAARVHAAQALFLMGPKARSQTTRLIEALQDPELLVVGTCIETLSKIGPDAVEAVPHLQALIKNKENPEVIRTMASSAVAVITGKGKMPKMEKKQVAPALGP